MAAWCAALVILGAAHVRAEEAPPPQFTRALAVTIKLGTEPQFEEFIRKYREAHDKVGTTAGWAAYSTILGPENRYLFASNFASFANLPTSGGPLVEAYGEAGAREVLALWRDSVLTSTSSTRVLRPDLSAVAEDTGDGPASHIYFELVTVRPGKNEAFEEWARRFSEATRKVMPGITYFGYEPLIGANNVYSFAAPVANPAEIDGWSMPLYERVERACGKRERDRLAALAEASVVSVENRLDVVRPDLARPTPAQDLHGGYGSPPRTRGGRPTRTAA
jgi:hypothetical protein